MRDHNICFRLLQWFRRGSDTPPGFRKTCKRTTLKNKRNPNPNPNHLPKIQKEKEYSGISSEQFLSKIGEISKSKEILFETAYHDLAKRNPIERRIGNVKSLSSFLKYRFKRFNIDIPFEFAIFNADSITRVKSENFVLDKNTFESALFTDENDESGYLIKVNFPKRTPFLVAPVISVAVVSIIFTFIGLYRNSVNENEIDAKTITSKAQNMYSDAQIDLAMLKFQNVIDDYDGTNASEIAKYYIAV